MHIDLVSDSRRTLPVHHEPETVGSIRIWNCRFDSYEPLRKYTELKTLVITGLAEDSLDFLRGMHSLRYLSLTDLPKVTDLTALGKLTSLDCLTLEGLTDRMGRGTEVESLDPIGKITSLRHLAVLGIKSRDKSLRPLENCRLLQTAQFDSMPAQEVQRFYNVMGNLNGRLPAPIYY